MGRGRGGQERPVQAFHLFCDRVCSMVRWKAARAPIAAELTAHLEDHTAALEAGGVPRDEAVGRAVAAMGDPYALGAELDRVHPPTLPRLSRVLVVLAVLALLAGLVIGVREDTGLFALTGLFPQEASLPYDGDGTLVLSGSAEGGGTLAGYTLTAGPEAGLALVSWEFPEGVINREYQLQCPVTVTHSPWQAPMVGHQTEALWTDDIGGSGYAIFSSYGEDALLGSVAWLRIVDPNPGARQFTVTIRSNQESVAICLTLEEEVPPL